jgi:hypothetical protein
MKLRGMVLLFAFAFTAASLGFAQTTGNDTTSAATSTNTINATVVTGGDGRQLIQAMPGSGTTIIPGVTSGNSPWKPYWPVLNRCIPVSQLMAAPRGRSKIKVYKEAASVVRDRPIDQVCLVDWQPDIIAHGADRKIGEATGTGKDGDPDDSAFMPTLKKLVMETNTRRVAVQRRSLGEFHTKTFSGGFGAAGSGTADNNIGGSGSFGVSLGSSKTKNEDPVEFDLIALNDGPVDPPVVQKSPDAPAGTGTSTALPPSQPESKAPSTPTLKVEVDLAAFTSMLQQLLPPKAAATPTLTSTTTAATPAATALDECLRDPIPGANVYFAFDYPKPDEGDVFSPTVMTEDGLKDNAAAIRAIQQWLENHHCNIDVVGYASHEASSAYNWNLSGRRAKAVIKALNEDEKIRGQVFEADSNGKESAAPTGTTEHDWQDRRISFRVRGSDSSGR